MKTLINRRGFFNKAAGVSAGIAGLTLMSHDSFSEPLAAEENIHLIGPKEGYSPHIGTLVSMMTWMRAVVFMSVDGLKQADLDYLHDPKSNTIGAMLLHLAATETFYQSNTFGWKDYKGVDASIDWEAASDLGDKGRSVIKGHDLDYYKKIMTDTRTKTLEEFKKRDDKWLFESVPFFQNKPTNISFSTTC